MGFAAQVQVFHFHIGCRRQNMDSNVIAGVHFIRVLVDNLIKGKGIAAVKFWVTVFLIDKNVVENKFGSLVDNFAQFCVFIADFPIDFLFFVGQKDIGINVFLD